MGKTATKRTQRDNVVYVKQVHLLLTSEQCADLKVWANQRGVGQSAAIRLALYEAGVIARPRAAQPTTAS